MDSFAGGHCLCSVAGLVQMKYFFRDSPQFVRRAVSERVQAGLANGPPFLRHGVSGHLRAVSIEVIADVLEVAEQVVFAVGQLPQVDRIVSDIACGDHRQRH